MNKTILLTGGAGYIGSHIAYALCDLGMDVIVYDDLSSGSKENIDPRCTFIEGSIFDINLLMKTLSNVNTVIHLAGLKDAGESMRNVSLYSKYNIEGALNVIKASVDKKVDKFIFSSSAAVYGNPDYLPIDENHKTRPINYYGFTKLCIEKNLNWFNKIYNIKVANLRYFNAAGYDLNNRIKVIEKNPSNLLPRVMEHLIGKKENIKIFGNDYNTKDGTCLRDYIHVTDLATAHIKAIDFLDNHHHPLVVNLSTGRSHSVLDVINKAQEISGKNIQYDIVKRRHGDTPELFSKSINSNKISWKPEFSSLEVILESMWKVYKDS